MSIEIKMPALSPTMEEGTLAKWLVKEGDTVQSGDLLAEIETDKATMEFEAVDEGVIGQIVVPAGTEGVKVGTVIAVMAGEGGTTAPAPVAKAAPEPSPAPAPAPVAPVAAPVPAPAPVPTPAIAPVASGNRVKASPIARRLAKARNIDLATLTGTGPNGRIVKVDVEAAAGVAPAPAVAIATSAPAAAAAPAPAPIAAQDFGIPHEAIKLSNMRKTIARRLTESKQTVPHIYLTVDVRLDALLKLRTELNASLASRGVKLSVNDLLIKALAQSLMIVPECNVQFAGDQMLQFSRANMGMMGIKQFEAVINPPQAMIMAIGAGEKRPYVIDDALGIATVMSATGSFDHRAIDGADGARLMSAFRELVEKPLGMLA
jgi:pyruvate dehydrogenase E2 component (dihydrolipoamide acetyltransferase)